MAKIINADRFYLQSVFLASVALSSARTDKGTHCLHRRCARRRPHLTFADKVSAF